MKKTSRIIFALAAMLCLPFASVSAEPAPKVVDYSTFEKLGELEKERDLTDDEVKAFLKKEGWVVVNKKTMMFDAQGNDISASAGEFSTMSLGAPDYVVDVFTTYNDRVRTEWAAYFSVEENTAFGELYPASYDMISVGWNDNIFNYSSHSADTSEIWAADLSKINEGAALFSMRDRAPHNNDASGYLGVKQKTGTGSVFTNFDVKFVHTFDKEQKTSTQGGQAGYTWAPGGGLTVGYSWSMTTSTTENNWTKADAVTFTTFNF